MYVDDKPLSQLHNYDPTYLFLEHFRWRGGFGEKVLREVLAISRRFSTTQSYSIEVDSI